MNCAPFPCWDALFNWLDRKFSFKRPKRPYTKRSACWQDMRAHKAKLKADREKAAMELATYGGLPQGSAVEMQSDMPVGFKF